MPKKRTSDEQTSEGSYVFQEDDDAKRARLASLYDTTLQDLPIELLECILVKAVAMEVNGLMEVKGLKLAKSVWEEKVDLVISRLRTVCSQWNSVLTTDFFRREVHRNLDGQETIRLEILHQPSFQSKVFKLTTMKDEIFLLCCPLDGGYLVINVYDRNNMAEVKDVIPLLAISPTDMAACSVSNCVYVLNTERYSPSIFRITKDEERHFKMSPWINDLRLPVSNRGPISVSADGNLIILSSQESTKMQYVCISGPHKYVYKPAYVGIYNANGSQQHKIKLSPDIYGHVNSVIQKSNGNLVLLSASDKNKAQLLEIDTNGAIVRQYQSSLCFGAYSLVSFADIHGRILINDLRNRIELLDPEFNPLEITGPRLLEDQLYKSTPEIHFNSERNEIVRLEMHKYMYYGSHEKFEGTDLSIFRFTEE